MMREIIPNEILTEDFCAGITNAYKENCEKEDA